MSAETTAPRRSSPRSSPTSASPSRSSSASWSPARRRCSPRRSTRSPTPATRACCCSAARRAKRAADAAAPVRLRPRALLLGVRRRAGAVHARRGCSRSTRASRSSSTRTSSSRRGGRSASCWSRIVLEGLSLPHRRARGRARVAARRSLVALHPRAPRRPELPVVLLEDTGALVGLVFALVGVIAVRSHRRRRCWDGVGTHRHRPAARRRSRSCSRSR